MILTLKKHLRKDPNLKTMKIKKKILDLNPMKIKIKIRIRTLINIPNLLNPSIKILSSSKILLDLVLTTSMKAFLML